MKVWIAVATWFIYSTVVFGSRRNLPSRVGHPDFPKVTFYADSYDQDTYTQFIDVLRYLLPTERTSYGIPVLAASASGDERFVLVELASEGNHRIVALDVVTAGVVGFISENEQSYFFNDVSDQIYSSSLFNDTTKHKLPFAGTYESLAEAGASREAVKLGIYPLNDAIRSLTNYAIYENDIAPSLVVVLQMVSEAARLELVHYKLTYSTNFKDGFYPKPDITSVQDAWVSLSLAIQSSQNGLFDEIELQDENGNTYTVSQVVQIEVYMALLRSNIEPYLPEKIKLWPKY